MEETISATPAHPFYVEGFGWTLAGNLRAGDVLVLSNGERVVVEWVQHEILEAPVLVYNFEVEDFHTYFVGECGVLVHNSCRNKGGRLGNQATREQNKLIGDELEKHGMTVTNGGGRINPDGSYLSEEYLRSLNGGRKGGNYVDITAVTSDGTKVRVNTVDVYADMTPTRRELNAAKSINSKLGPNEPKIILIPKGDGIGDLISELEKRGLI